MQSIICTRGKGEGSEPVVKVQIAEEHAAGAKQAAEKLSCCQVLCQGTTLVVPIEAKMNFRL